MKVLVAGGRDLDVTKRRVRTVADWLRELNATEVIEGGCETGGDRIGRLAAEDLSLPVTTVSAEWAKYGKSAGPIRNAEMAKLADAAILLPGGRGTQHMRREAMKAGLWKVVEVVW